MIIFRKKVQDPEDLMPEALKRLSEAGVTPTIIKADEADEMSKRNSRSLVIMEFIQNSQGNYQLTVKDKEYYSWTRKLLSDIFKLKITSVNEKKREVTAETEYLGHALDAIEIIGGKYNKNLYVVCQ